MKAMVLAAGLGTRLKPITFEIPKPMVPVLDLPVMGHTVRMLRRQGFDQLIANLHYYPDSIRGYFGDLLEYRHEEELLGTAGGVRGVRDFFGDDPVVVVSGDALTDLDLRALLERHHSAGGIGSLTVKRVPDTREYGVVIHDADGRIEGFQEKPDPAEALSDLANCMIYVLEPEIFDYFPEKEEVDFALDVFPALLSGDIPFGVHASDEYWNDVGSLPEYLQGNLDVITGAVNVEPAGRIVDSPSELDVDVELEGRVLLGDDVRIGDGARLDGPLVIGPGSRIGARARVRESVLLGGTEIPDGGLLAAAIAGNGEVLAKG
jgi:mannose-1-phosphate guanylyltransferase